MLGISSAAKACVNPEAGELRIRIANLRHNEVFGTHADVVFVFRDVDDCGEVFFNLKDLKLVRSVRVSPVLLVLIHVEVLTVCGWLPANAYLPVHVGDQTQASRQPVRTHDCRAVA